MDKDRKFVGQPILSQVLSCIPSEIIRSATNKYSGDRYYKRIPVKTHLISLLYGVLSYSNGLREICEGMLACEGKLLINVRASMMLLHVAAKLRNGTLLI